MTDPAQTQTDVSRPSALPTAKLGNRSNVSGNSLLYMDANEYLDNFQEDLNKRVDTEIETLVDGMVDLVELASVRQKNKFQVAQESFQIQMRAESMVRAANSLLSITHSLKLMHLLSDDSQTIRQRDTELQKNALEIEDYKKKVAQLIDELVDN